MEISGERAGAQFLTEEWLKPSKIPRSGAYQTGEIADGVEVAPSPFAYASEVSEDFGSAAGSFGLSDSGSTDISGATSGSAISAAMGGMFSFFCSLLSMARMCEGRPPKRKSMRPFPPWSFFLNADARGTEPLGELAFKQEQFRRKVGLSRALGRDAPRHLLAIPHGEPSVIISVKSACCSCARSHKHEEWPRVALAYSPTESASCISCGKEVCGACWRRIRGFAHTFPDLAVLEAEIH